MWIAPVTSTGKHTVLDCFSLCALHRSLQCDARSSSSPAASASSNTLCVNQALRDLLYVRARVASVESFGPPHPDSVTRPPAARDLGVCDAGAGRRLSIIAPRRRSASRPRTARIATGPGRVGAGDGSHRRHVRGCPCVRATRVESQAVGWMARRRDGRGELWCDVLSLSWRLCEHAPCCSGSCASCSRLARPTSLSLHISTL